MEYLHKIEVNDFQDILWNIPEQKRGRINIVGGNAKTFRASIKTAEYLIGNYPLAGVDIVMPDVLKTKLPLLPNFTFLSSTDTGSFADEAELEAVFNEADYNLIIGDLSKNKLTGRAITSACENSALPLLITRDAVDLITENTPDKILLNENAVIFGSMVQLQKLFRAVYYPKMLLLNQSLIQIAEALHKFTLSYPVAIITMHDSQVIVVKNGDLNVIPLEKSGFTPITFWGGEMAAKIVALNLYNPDCFMRATSAAVFG